ncbi:MAG: hypothetical protein CL821_01145 [Crocinitomicaceae bacterium]|nr:hypothetical protein [Crocinitomicaceae bacterium]|tara:strand:- start:17779 stop:18684 length:906 start_codon:yes stop_codon:yes gene_type:complete
MNRLLFLLSISLAYISCEKVIPFDGDVNTPKLVINSIFQSDSSFKVHVSSSRSVIDTASFKNIDDAIVTIKDRNENIIETLNHVENGFYKGQTFPQENQTYILEVNHPNYANITASDSLPSPITINSVDTSTIIDPINGNRLQISMNFDDPENTQNYYLIETYSVNEYLVIKNSDTTEYELDTTKQFMVLTDEVFQNGGSPWREQGLFNDLLFNGQNKTLELEIPNDSWSGSEDGYDWSYQTLTLRLYLHNITLSYYYYRTSLELFQNASGNPFAQPVQVFSNVENGFGVFAGSQISFFDL